MRVVVVLCCVVLATSCLLGGTTTDDDAFKVMNRWLSKAPAVRNIYVGWANTTTLPTTFGGITAAWGIGQVPMISWMPYPYATWLNPSPNVDIVNGDYDDYIGEFMKLLKAFLSGVDGVYGTKDDRRAYIRFGHEMNGDWYPWSPACPACGTTGQKISQTSQSFVDLWKYIWNWTFNTTALDADHVQFIFAVNNIDAVNEAWKMEDFWPGDDYVHWIGVDGYNWGNTLPDHDWETPTQVFDSMVQRLRALASDLPLAACEYATGSIPNGVPAKSSWITDAFTYFNTTDFRLVSYLNIDKDDDWAVFGGKNGLTTWKDTTSGTDYNVYETYNAAVNQSWIISSDFSSERLLTTKQFQTGQD